MPASAVGWPGNHLHRLFSRAVFPDVGEVLPSVHQQTVPLEENFLGERRREVPVELDHHFRDAGFCGRNFAIIRGEAKLPAD